MKPQDLLARLEAGYEYDPMYGQLCNERDRLAADNAKLREQIDAAHMSRLLTENENESLRELMADMLRYYAMPNDIDYKREADLLERAHEMGVDA